MTPIYLGLGSNINPAEHLPQGIAALRELLGACACSATYEGEALGFEGPPFWNLVVAAQTTLQVAELQHALRSIEYRFGRPVNATRLSSRTLDIDILTYGDRCGLIDGVQLPRDEIQTAAFVLRPLAELAPDAIHPSLQRSYRDLWAAFDHASQPLQLKSLMLA